MRRFCLSKYFLYGIPIYSFSNPNYGFANLGVVSEKVLYSTWNPVSRLRGFCFSFALFQKEIHSCNSFSCFLLMSAALLLKVDKKKPQAFVSSCAWPLVCSPVLSLPMLLGTQQRYAEVDVLNFPGVSIFRIMPDHRSRGEEPWALGSLCRLCVLAEARSPPSCNHTQLDKHPCTCPCGPL